MVRRLVGGGNDRLIAKAKAACPSRVEKGTDSPLPIGRQVSSSFPESWVVAWEVEDKCYSHICPPFSSFPPAFIAEHHARWYRIALWPARVGC